MQPQHIPGLSIIMSISLTLLGQYNFLLIGLQGPGQKSPFHSCFLWSHFYAELDLLSSVLTALYSLPVSLSPLLEYQPICGQDTLSTVPPHNWCHLCWWRGEGDEGP